MYIYTESQNQVPIDKAEEKQEQWSSNVEIPVCCNVMIPMVSRL